MRLFWQRRKGWIVLMGLALTVAAVLQAQPPDNQATGRRGDRANRLGRMVMGTVESVQGQRIVIKARDGQSRTVTVRTETTLTRLARGTKEDLKKGTIVQVRGQYDPKRAWFIPRVVQVGEGILPAGGRGTLTGVGTVYNVQNNQIHLTLSLALTNETRIIRHERIQADQLRAGENIVARGEPGENDTLRAQNVIVGDLQVGMGRDVPAGAAAPRGAKRNRAPRGAQGRR